MKHTPAIRQLNWIQIVAKVVMTFLLMQASPAAASPAATDFSSARRASDSSRQKLETYGLVVKTQIENSRYVVNWSLSDNTRSGGNLKGDFEDALREMKSALENESAALQASFGKPKNQNEVMFAADAQGRLQLVNYTLDSISNLASFSAVIEWALRSHIVMTVPQCQQNCANVKLYAKLEHMEPTRSDFDLSTTRTIISATPTSPQTQTSPAPMPDPTSANDATQTTEVSIPAAPPTPAPISSEDASFNN